MEWAGGDFVYQLMVLWFFGRKAKIAFFTLVTYAALC